MNFESWIAFRYLKSPRIDKSISAITVISIISVGLGVAALIVVLSVMNGFERDLRNALLGANPHLTIFSFDPKDQPILEKDPLLELARETINPKAVLPSISHQALLIGKNKPAGAYVRGIDPQSELQDRTMEGFLALSSSRKLTEKSSETEKTQIAKEVLAGLEEKTVKVRTASGKARKEKLAGIILGKLLARNLGAKPGDAVQLYSSAERISPLGNIASAKKFRVAGIYSSGLAGYDEILAFIDIRQAQKVFQMGNQISSIAIYLDKPYDAQKYAEQLEEKISFPYIIRTWIEDNQNLFQVIQLEKFGLALILGLIILVAAFNIISSLIILVKEKGKDVAVLKSLGAKDRSIRKIFMIQGIFIGSVGTMGGILLGLIFCYIVANYNVIDIPADVYVKSKIPIYVDWVQILMISAVSLLICFFVTIYPARKAARMNPIEGLKYE